MPFLAWTSPSTFQCDIQRLSRRGGLCTSHYGRQRAPPTYAHSFPHQPKAKLAFLAVFPGERLGALAKPSWTCAMKSHWSITWNSSAGAAADPGDVQKGEMFVFDSSPLPGVP